MVPLGELFQSGNMSIVNPELYCVYQCLIRLTGSKVNVMSNIDLYSRI